MIEWWTLLWSVASVNWLIFGLLLLGLVAVTHVFDLLWIAVAAIIISILTYVFPGMSLLWQNIIFFSSLIIFVPLGRLWSKRFNSTPSSHPNLNNRAAQMMGKQGTALGDFENGTGQMKAGDSQWRARSDGHEDIMDGTRLEVIAAEGTVLIVRAWQADAQTG